MLARHALAVLPLVALARGGPLAARNPVMCNVGSTAQCCQSVQSAGSPQMSTLLELFDLVVPLENNQVGTQCTALTGAGSNVKCEASPVCCNDSRFNGMINVGCTPINL